MLRWLLIIKAPVNPFRHLDSLCVSPSGTFPRKGSAVSPLGRGLRGGSNFSIYDADNGSRCCLLEATGVNCSAWVKIAFAACRPDNVAPSMLSM